MVFAKVEFGRVEEPLARNRRALIYHLALGDAHGAIWRHDVLTSIYLDHRSASCDQRRGFGIDDRHPQRAFSRLV